jgi:hypothetical protein
LSDTPMSFARAKTVLKLIQRPYVLAPLVVVTLALILLSRRPDAIFDPGVWNEEGIYILPSILKDGLGTVFVPVNGYLITVPKLISLIAAGISATQYPLIATSLTWLFIVAVGVAIVFSPTTLRHPFLAAVAVFLIPSDPEVFGIALYSFWWASILMFLLCLWDPARSHLGWRLAFLILGGLSSPIVFIIIPALLWRAYRYRAYRHEWVIAGVGVVVAALQLATVLSYTYSAHQSLTGSPELVSTLRYFFGDYLARSWITSHTALYVVGAVLLAFIVFMVLRRIREDQSFLVLSYLLIGSMASSLLRAGATEIDPWTQGPRYFFFPFLLISWILIQSIRGWSPKWFVGVPIAFLVIASVNSAAVWSRPNDNIHWSAHVVACAKSNNDKYVIPVQFTGTLHWTLVMSHSTCAAWLARDPFRPQSP